MGWKLFWSLVAFLFLSSLLFFYFFIPYNKIEFIGMKSSNFSLPTYDREMQFYPNMRYPSKEISYKIDDECILKKKNDMGVAFSILEENTILDFYEVAENEEISIACSEKDIVEERLFIAGEGGPTKIIAGDKFNVIFYGTILLIRGSQCEKPNIALHELFHALGFNHSLNSGNVMYPVSNCNQEIGEDIPELINKLYSYPSYSDLGFAEASANMEGRYLNVNITIKNLGLRNSEKAEIEIYADEKLVKEIELEPINIGEGRIITLENVWIFNANIDTLDFIINSDFNELEKENNKITLKIKK